MHALVLILAAAPICTYSHPAARLPALTLRLSGDGAPFATTTPTRATIGIALQLPRGDANQGAQLTVTTRDVTLTANATKNIQLSLRATRRLSPMLTLARGGRVTWTGSHGNLLRVEAHLGDGLEGAPFSFTARCNELDAADLEIPFEELDVPPAEGAPYHYARVPQNSHVPVSSNPGEKPEFFISHSGALLVLGELRGFSHVRGWFGALLLDGWVPGESLVRTDREDFENNEIDFEDSREATRCLVEVPLLLRFNGGLTAIGKLGKHAAVRVLSREDGGVTIALPALPWLQLQDGAAFALDAQSAPACTSRGIP